MKRKSAVFRRTDGRRVDQLRTVSFEPGVAPSATGSVLVSMGKTQVICAASIEDDVPVWMKRQKVAGGWVTAEYSLLPYSTTDRTRREATAGKVSGRTQEIQRLIGRAMRAVIDLDALGSRTIWIDCDVLQADGGTRTASITGAWVAVRRALDTLLKQGRISTIPLKSGVAAVSVGIVNGVPMLDLNYEEDAAASVDMNVVMTSTGTFVEVQGTAEENPFSRPELDAMLKLAAGGIRKLITSQRAALK